MLGTINRDFHLRRVLLLAGLLLAATGCQVLEQVIVYHPSRYPHKWNPPVGCELCGLEFEDACFESCDGKKLHGWFIQPAGTVPQNVVLFTHGRSGNVSSLKSHTFEFVKRHQVAVLIFDYRGFGKSEGRPSECGIYRDASAAHDWLAQRTGVDRSEIVLMGRSLGAAIAIDLASRQGAKALILENGMTSIPDVIRFHTNDRLDGHRILDACYASTGKIGTFPGPVFISHGKDDRLIPSSHSETLAQSAVSSSAVQFVLNEGNHRSPPTPEYREALDAFLKSL